MNFKLILEKYQQLSMEVDTYGSALECTDEKTLRIRLKTVKSELRSSCESFKELELLYIGEIEHYLHDCVPISLTNANNQNVVGRARVVALTRIERLEQRIESIEKSLEFNLAMRISKIGVGLAATSLLVSLTTYIHSIL
ncbi:hypothetical protein [Vibrio sinaloensis]|uniref:Uncharacterized protein n=1 Tax=Photobacterium sp. (strain ATCC 43367) TaxID=379097 RepID=A0A0A5HYA9_PHOS4|nr:hypothetical protein [Vibrio sinaloensis]KGY10537.1 hypothetical protein NM06_01635 [Vibrio sinaloensis]